MEDGMRRGAPPSPDRQAQAIPPALSCPSRPGCCRAPAMPLACRCARWERAGVRSAAVVLRIERRRRTAIPTPTGESFMSSLRGRCDHLNRSPGPSRARRAAPAATRFAGEGRDAEPTAPAHDARGRDSERPRAADATSAEQQTRPLPAAPARSVPRRAVARSRLVGSHPWRPRRPRAGIQAWPPEESNPLTSRLPAAQSSWGPIR